MQNYKIKTVKGELPVHVIAPDKFGGEYDRRSLFYVGGVWAASALAMVTNLAQALYRKVAHGGSLDKILWEMGRDRDHISSFAVDRLSKFNHRAKYRAAGWRSLDLFYNYHERIKPQLKGDFEGLITRHWIGKLENRQAVTNRLKISIDLLVAAFSEFPAEKEIRIFSIASGSAQAVVEAIKRCPQLDIKVLLLDVDTSAINESKKMVRDAGLDAHFSYINDTTKVMEDTARTFQPHIIEMVGFLDYRRRKQAIDLIDRIRMHLPEGGIFITCNIRKNREKIFLDWILLWPMIYRSEEEFADVLVNAGFPAKNIRLIYEPFKIHGIAVCRK
jgi:Putative lysophospholipase.